MYTIENGEDAEQVIKFLEEKIYDHNAASINQLNGNYFSWIIKDAEGKIIAGIAGWTWANACEISQLWVEDTMRGKGLGKVLIEKVEAAVKLQHCNMILIKSYSFQAPYFYVKQGYQIDYIKKDFPKGQDYYILTKEIP